MPDGYTIGSYFEHVAREGFAQRLPRLKDLALRGVLKHTIDEYERRLTYEIEMIKQMKYPGYFLITWDFIRYAREKGIPVGPGRGSAAGRNAAGDGKRRQAAYRADLADRARGGVGLASGQGRGHGRFPWSRRAVGGGGGEGRKAPLPVRWLAVLLDGRVDLLLGRCQGLLGRGGAGPDGLEPRVQLLDPVGVLGHEGH